jgi:hypothetical protein
MSYQQGRRLAIAGAASFTVTSLAALRADAVHAHLALDHAGPHVELVGAKILAVFFIAITTVATVAGAIRIIAHRPPPEAADP